MPRTPKPSEKTVATLRHGDKRLNNPTAELASLFEQQAEMLGDERDMRIARDRPLAEGETRPRDADSDPQIVWSNAKVRLTQAQLKALARGEEIDLSEAQLTWRGKDAQDWSDLVVNAPPLYIQEKIHPKAIIDDLKRPRTREVRHARSVRRFQRARRPRGGDGILSARQALAEPHDPGRLASGDGEPRRARGFARQGAVHLFRPALRDQVQLELAGLDAVARREGRQGMRRGEVYVASAEGRMRSAILGRRRHAF